MPWVQLRMADDSSIMISATRLTCTCHQCGCAVQGGLGTSSDPAYSHCPAASRSWLGRNSSDQLLKLVSSPPTLQGSSQPLPCTQTHWCSFRHFRFTMTTNTAARVCAGLRIINEAAACTQCCGPDCLQHLQVRSWAEAVPATRTSLVGWRRPGSVQSVCPLWHCYYYYY